MKFTLTHSQNNGCVALSLSTVHIAMHNFDCYTIFTDPGMATLRL